jgi:amidase
MLDKTTPQLARLLARGEISALELMRASLKRIAALNPRHNALVNLREEAVLLAEARASDRRRRAGKPRGPLEGLPTALKDTAAAKGLPSTHGSPLFRDLVPDYDALSVGRIRAAGAIVVGRSNVPEFGFGSHSYNTVFGTTRNAWDPALSAGGSSGGAAVAVALGMVPLADGSDVLGSLRNPAAWNNLFGFRPSMGRVPVVPHLDAFWGQLYTEGPMGRTVEELRFLLAVQAGPDSRAPFSLAANAALGKASLKVAVKGQRILWLGDLGGHLPFDAGILPLCETALGAFRAQGCKVSAGAPALDWEAIWQAFVALRHYEIGLRYDTIYADPATRAQMKPEAQWEVAGFRRLSAADLAAAAKQRHALFQAFATVFEAYDAVAIPTAQCFAFPAEWDWPKQVGGRTMDSYHRWMEVTALATMLGCPAANVPVGFDNGRPMGMQVIGRPGADLATLQLARAYQEATPWADMRPPT